MTVPGSLYTIQGIRWRLFCPALRRPCWYLDVPAEAVDNLSKISIMAEALEVSKASSDSHRHASVPCDCVLNCEASVNPHKPHFSVQTTITYLVVLYGGKMIGEIAL